MAISKNFGLRRFKRIYNKFNTGTRYDHTRINNTIMYAFYMTRNEYTNYIVIQFRWNRIACIYCTHYGSILNKISVESKDIYKIYQFIDAYGKF